MYLFKYCQIFLFILASFFAHAQTIFQIKGQIVDEQTKESIPYAHVYLENTSIGTVSNSEGYYILKIDSSQNYKSLIVSCIGYNNATIVVKNITKNKRFKINLKPSYSLLNQVIITPKSIEDIIREAIRRIPENYATSETILTGFYRTSHDGLSKGILYIFEALLEVYKKSYTKKHEKGQIKMLKGRKKEFDSLKLSRIKFYGGPHLPHNNDFIIKRFEFINEKDFKHFDYQLVDITTYDEKQVYIIKFTSKSNSFGNYNGYIYIDVASYAMIKAEYKFTKKGLQTLNSNFPFPNNPFFKWYQSNRNVNFRKIGQKWYLYSIWGEARGYDKTIPDSVISLVEYVTTKIDTIDIKPLDYQNRIQYTDIFLDKIDTFDQNFWRNNNIISNTNNFQKQFINKKLNQQIQKTDFKPPQVIKNTKVSRKYESFQKRLTILSKFSGDFSLFLAPLYPEKDRILLRYSNSNFEINTEKRFPNPLYLVGLSSTIFYDFSSNWFISLNTKSTFPNKNKFEDLSLGLGYNLNLSRKNRPFHIRPSIALAYTNLRMSLGTFDNSQKLTINKKTFDAQRIAIHLVQRRLVFQPRLALAWELSHRWDLVGEAVYFMPLKQYDGILFQEKSGFFLTRKKTNKALNDNDIFLTNANEELTELPVRQNVYFSIGFLFKFKL